MQGETATTLKRAPGGLRWIVGSACLVAALIWALIHLTRSNGSPTRAPTQPQPALAATAAMTPPAPAAPAPPVARAESPTLPPLVVLQNAAQPAKHADAPKPAVVVSVKRPPARRVHASASSKVSVQPGKGPVYRSNAAVQAERLQASKAPATIIMSEQPAAPDSDITLLKAVLAHNTRVAEEQARAEAIRCAGMRAHGKHCVEKVSAVTTVR